MKINQTHSNKISNMGKYAVLSPFKPKTSAREKRLILCGVWRDEVHLWNQILWHQIWL